MASSDSRPTVSPTVKSTAGAAIIVACIAFIRPFEGVRLTAYRDPVGVATICMGETKDVQMGMHKTLQQCLDDMRRRLPDYLGPVDRLMPGLPDNRRIAYTDFAWNLGSNALTVRQHIQGRAVAGSSIVELERAGHWQDACERMLRFNKGGGQVLPGLVKRRQKERDLCLGH